MKPPKYAKSVTVQAPENGVTLVQLTAIYKGNEKDDETVTVTLTKEGESHTFPEKTEDMGSWTAVRPIHVIKGQIGDEGGKLFELSETESNCPMLLPVPPLIEEYVP